jgi:hypothetical protein
VNEIKNLKEKIKSLEGLMYKENLRMKHEHNQILKENDKMLLDNNQLDIQSTPTK